jgi:hypothetical protein
MRGDFSIKFFLKKQISWRGLFLCFLPAFFFSLHLDGLKTPIYFILFTRIQANKVTQLYWVIIFIPPIYSSQTIVKWVARIAGGIQKKVKESQPKPPLYAFTSNPSPKTKI